MADEGSAADASRAMNARTSAPILSASHQNTAWPQTEQPFRGAHERLSEARSQRMQAESRLQLEPGGSDIGPSCTRILP